MNAFNSMEGILGEARTSHLDRAFEEFLGQSRLIRDGLGKQSYIFDRYLSLLFGAVTAKPVGDISEECTAADSSLLMCLEIIRHNPKRTDNPKYDLMKSYIDANPLPYQEEATQQALYCAALDGGLLKHEANLFSEELTEAFRAAADIVELRDLYRKICAVLGGENEMEKLNILFRQRFLIAPPTAVFLQCMTNRLISLLLRRDFETSKQVFQIILDGNIT